MEVINEDKMLDHRFESFKTEVFMMRRNPHKNIIQLKDHLICDQSISYLIMEFKELGSLYHRIKQLKRHFTEKEAQSYFAQIANAIHLLHLRGITHTDIKLSNV